MQNKGTCQRTLATAPSFFAGAFFLVMPAGFAALALVTGLVVVVAGVFLVLGLMLRLMVGSVSTGVKTRGLEWPVADRVPSRGILAGLVGKVELTYTKG